MHWLTCLHRSPCSMFVPFIMHGMLAHTVMMNYVADSGPEGLHFSW
jgi:hypothetical protein